MSSPPRAEAIGRLVAARELKELTRLLGENGVATASGLWGSSVAAVVGTVARELKRPIVLVCGHIDEADDLADDLELFTARRPEVVPTLEIGGSLGQVSEEQVSNRLRLIDRLASGSASSLRSESGILVAPIQS